MYVCSNLVALLLLWLTSTLLQSYQTELLTKRELLADFTYEEITVSDFAGSWPKLDEVRCLAFTLHSWIAH